MPFLAIYSCDHYVRNEYRIGDLQSSRLGELVELPAQRGFGRAKREALPKRCNACPWLDICNGGCPKDRFLTEPDGKPGVNWLCDGLREFFAYAENPVRRVMSLRKRGMTATAIMTELRAERRALWKGIGRNDPCPCGSGLKAKQCCWDIRP